MHVASRAAAWVLAATLAPLVCSWHALAAPIPLIFDTDVGNDVDDVLALGMIHQLQSLGECRLLAVTVTKDYELAAPFADAVNTFYGRGDIPIGVVRRGATPEPGRFLQLADQHDGGKLRFPHDLARNADAPDAVAVLRRALASADDDSVVIAQVGFSTNLARLLDSPADDATPLNGVELVRKKVRLLSLMAGSFSAEGAKLQAEYNVKNDVAACQKLVARWPAPMVFSGLEVGLAVTYPAESIERDYAYVPHHPLAEAYQLYEPPPHNRPCWDLTSVIYALRPEANCFGVSKPGRVSVDAQGATTFAESPDGPHRYLTVDDEQAPSVREEFVKLCSAPPARGPAPSPEK